MNPKSIPLKRHWLDITVEIHTFHISQLKDDSSWTLSKSAKALNRSIGSISEALLVASFLLTHEKQIKRCHSMREALEYIRSLQKQIRLRAVNG